MCLAVVCYKRHDLLHICVHVFLDCEEHPAAMKLFGPYDHTEGAASSNDILILEMIRGLRLDQRWLQDQTFANCRQPLRGWPRGRVAACSVPRRALEQYPM